MEKSGFHLSLDGVTILVERLDLQYPCSVRVGESLLLPGHLFAENLPGPLHGGGRQKFSYVFTQHFLGSKSLQLLDGGADIGIPQVQIRSPDDITDILRYEPVALLAFPEGRLGFFMRRNVKGDTADILHRPLLIPKDLPSALHPGHLAAFLSDAMLPEIRPVSFIGLLKDLLNIGQFFWRNQITPGDAATAEVFFGISG